MRTHSETLLYDNPLLSKPLELAHINGASSATGHDRV